MIAIFPIIFPPPHFLLNKLILAYVLLFVVFQIINLLNVLGVNKLDYVQLLNNKQESLLDIAIKRSNINVINKFLKGDGIAARTMIGCRNLKKISSLELAVALHQNYLVDILTKSVFPRDFTDLNLAILDENVDINIIKVILEKKPMQDRLKYILNEDLAGSSSLRLAVLKGRKDVIDLMAKDLSLEDQEKFLIAAKKVETDLIGLKNRLLCNKFIFEDIPSILKQFGPSVLSGVGLSLMTLLVARFTACSLCDFSGFFADSLALRWHRDNPNLLLFDDLKSQDMPIGFFRRIPYCVNAGEGISFNDPLFAKILISFFFLIYSYKISSASARINLSVCIAFTMMSFILQIKLLNI